MNDSKQIIQFLVVALILYLGWYVCYDLLLSDSRFDNWLSAKETSLSAKSLSYLGYNATAEGYTVLINKFPVVYVTNSCNGMVLFALFSGFILAYPGQIKAKFFFIPAGVLVLFILNVLRIMALALNSWHSRHTLDFNHKYTFSVIVYAFIFIFWVIWTKRYAQPKTTLSA